MNIGKYNRSNSLSKTTKKIYPWLHSRKQQNAHVIYGSIEHILFRWKIYIRHSVSYSSTCYYCIFFGMRCHTISFSQILSNKWISFSPSFEIVDVCCRFDFDHFISLFLFGVLCVSLVQMLNDFKWANVSSIFISRSTVSLYVLLCLWFFLKHFIYVRYYLWFALNTTATSCLVVFKIKQTKQTTEALIQSHNIHKHLLQLKNSTKCVFYCCMLCSVYVCECTYIQANDLLRKL